MLIADIGRWKRLSSANFFSGSIDEVRIYNRALSADEIRQHYNQKKPVLEMKFDEGSGTSTKDESFNNNDGTLYSGAVSCSYPPTANCPTWTQGKYGSAIQFDGVDDFVDVSDSNSLDITGSLTVSAWIKPDAKTASYRTVISKGSNATTPFGIRMDRSSETNSIFGAVYTTSRTETNYVSLTNGVWYHVALVYDGSSVTLFVNGVSSGGVAKTGALSTNAINLMIGKNSSPGEFWAGSIDSVRIYNYARTPQEILVDYNNGLAAHLR